MTQTDNRIINGLGKSVKHFVKETVWLEVMEGSDGLTSFSEGESYAEWVKEAMDRLDNLVDIPTRMQIMQNCGQNCLKEYQELMEFAKERRKNSKSVNDFLDNEQRQHYPGMKLKRVGNTLYQVYDPVSFSEPMRCYCHLMRNLPSDETISLTYCHCSEGFIKSYWEEVLEMPLRVEILESTISGGEKCRFAIHLPKDLKD
jgi:hypothetical protein